MNSFLLAAIVMIALLAAVLLLKKRASYRKTPPTEAGEPAEATAPESVPPPAKEPLSEPVMAAVPEAPRVVPRTEEVHVSLRGETVAAAETAAAALVEKSAAIVLEEAPKIAALEEAVRPFVKKPDAGIAEAPVTAEECKPAASEELPSAQRVGLPEEVSEEEALPVTETVVPVGIEEPEEKTAIPEPVTEPQPALVEVVKITPLEKTGEPETAVGADQQVQLTLEAYSIRLNLLEERPRALLTQAMQHRDEKKRDQLQRELVIMNDKLALVADSFTAEISCYQGILEALEQVQSGVDDDGLAAAKDNLRKGDPQAAEIFFARLSEQPHPLAARAAFFSGQLAECRVDLQPALDRYRRAVNLEPDNPQYLQAAGKTARSIYRYNEALTWLESFVKLSNENKESNPVEQALAQRELAYTYVLSGQYQKAGPLYKESMTTLAKQLGQDHPEMATSWYQLGELQETLGEYDKAVALYKKSLEIFERKRGQEHPVLAVILDKLAALCMELEMEKQAVPLYERLVRIREKALRPTHPQLALSLNNLAESYRLQSRYAEAEACYQKSLVINETLHGKEHPGVAAVLQELAKLCTSQRKAAEAQQYQQRATAIFQKSVEASEKRTGQEALTLEI